MREPEASDIRIKDVSKQDRDASKREVAQSDREAATSKAPEVKQAAEPAVAESAAADPQETSQALPVKPHPKERLAGEFHTFRTAQFATCHTVL